MRTRIIVAGLAAALALVLAAPGARAGSAHRLGVGANYWTTVNNIDVKNVDQHGLSYLLTYQWVPSTLLRLEGDLELFPSDFTGGSGAIWAPQGFVMTGIGPLYGGLGVGIYYRSGALADAPFYVARVGLDMEILPQIYLDINANYRFDDWGKIRDLGGSVSSDTVRLGAAVRLGF